MDIRQTKILMESLSSESNAEDIQKALSLPGIGEFIQIEFNESTSPQDLIAGMTGIMDEIHRSKHDQAILREYGFTKLHDVQEFLAFAERVVGSPEEYFAAYNKDQMQLESVEAKIRRIQEQFDSE